MQLQVTDTRHFCYYFREAITMVFSFTVIININMQELIHQKEISFIRK